VAVNGRHSVNLLDTDGVVKSVDRRSRLVEHETGLPMPGPTPERRHMLTRDEALCAFRALDDAGFSCGLYANRDSHDKYSVMVTMTGLGAKSLSELHDVLKVVPDALTKVQGEFLKVS
jgi:hypothetical protein